VYVRRKGLGRHYTLATLYSERNERRVTWSEIREQAWVLLFLLVGWLRSLRRMMREATCDDVRSRWLSFVISAVSCHA
jgi:hypothetical protein